MSEVATDIDLEKREILHKYHGLLRGVNRRKITANQKKLIRRAFEVAIESHKDTRRKSGEPYIYHPIAVASICTGEIGLGPTSVMCALLHDVVEDTDMSLEEIESIFGKKVASIIDGLTKISGVTYHAEQSVSIQAENFRKVLLTLSEDVRVILIKLADRLHNMRTLGALDKAKQLKIASETLYLYAPLAHRLGFYNIKSELEDLAMKYTEPDMYTEIEQKLQKTQAVRARFVSSFTLPIRRALTEQHVNCKIVTRTKSVSSIWNKIRHKGVPFEEVYDVFAIRIIIDVSQEEEKAVCWKVYSIVTDFYKPNPDRLRDWVSTPKTNGYESLHTTVMSPTGKWVEVQIRSTRMDEIAEKGLAAHWKYKESSSESQLDEWIKKIRELLEDPSPNALDFIDDFKLNLFADEIFVFTPKGDLKTMPKGATALDFAFEIHSEVGTRCIGAKVNYKLVPLSYELKSGDQVEIITSDKQKPKDDWLNYVVSGKAKSKIKAALKEEKRRIEKEGKQMLEEKFQSMNIPFTKENTGVLRAHYRLKGERGLFYRIGTGVIDLKKLKDFPDKDKLKIRIKKKEKPPSLEELVQKTRGKSDMLVIGDNLQKIDYKLSPCCNPIPGDDVFGFVTINEGIKIHRINCPNAVQLMSNYAYRIVKTRWRDRQSLAFLAGIKLTGIDDVGVVNTITKIISKDMNVNMRSVNFDSNDGIFEGTIMVYVHDTVHLKNLTNNLKNAKGVLTVERIQ